MSNILERITLKANKNDKGIKLKILSHNFNCLFDAIIFCYLQYTIKENEKYFSFL